MLKDQTAIVTGGSRGIGAAIALRLAQEGANVAIFYAGNQTLAEEVAARCREFGVKAESYCCNVADFNAVKEMVAQVKADFETVNILINNAGITRDGLIAMMKEPMTVPRMEARPPAMDVPPMTQAAMASLLKVSPLTGWTVV